MARELTGPARVAYHSFGRISGMEAYQERLEALVQAASTGAQVNVIRLQDAVVAGKGFASAQALEVPALLRSIKQAVDNGHEAVGIGNGFDPGLWEARELFDAPILGLFETVALYALRVGWRFGVIASGESGIARIEEMALRYGLASRMVKPVALGVTVPQVVSAFSNAGEAHRIAHLVVTGTRELAARGAEVVVVASGALDVFIATQPEVQSPLPILPSVKILVRELEATAFLARLGVPFVSRVGRFRKPPDEISKLLSP